MHFPEKIYLYPPKFLMTFLFFLVIDHYFHIFVRFQGVNFLFYFTLLFPTFLFNFSLFSSSYPLFSDVLTLYFLFFPLNFSYISFHLNLPNHLFPHKMPNSTPPKMGMMKIICFIPPWDGRLWCQWHNW